MKIGKDPLPRSASVFLLALCALLAPLGREAFPDAAASQSVVLPSQTGEILVPDSYWRWFLTLRKPLIPVEALRSAGQNASEPMLLVGRVVPPPYNEVDHQDSPPPPDGW
ncbi:MAG: hypothetical protein ACUVWX_14735, partial [Kiritimatiellia bacterium]